MLQPAWDWVASRLAVSYARGLLVPFIGSGLSMPACPSWTTLVTRLEDRAGLRHGEGSDEAALVRRANHAVLALRNVATTALKDAVRDILVGGQHEVDIPEATLQLASVYWPLVISTNYDNLYATAHQRAHRKREDPPEYRNTLVLGRSPTDCFRVARSLREVTPPILWAIQGFVDAPMSDVFDESGRLAAELVIGHQEYRRATFRDAHFRRTFAEVFRTRSFLFLGSGLAEHYVLDLFSEIQEFYGPNGHLHFAVARKGTVDIDFLLREFQVAVLEYDAGSDGKDYSEFYELMRTLPVMLRTGRDNKTMRRTGAIAARWEVDVNGKSDHGDARFVVECSPLPLQLPTQSSAIAVSAGKQPGNDALYFSKSIQETLARLNAPPAGFGIIRHNVARNSENVHVFAVLAREHDARQAAPSTRDEPRTLAAVYWATRHLLSAAVVTKHDVIHSQLLASGPGLFYFDHGEERLPYLPVHALAEMAAAFGDFVRTTAVDRLRLIVHVVDPAVHAELRHGRFNLEELIGALDMRLWVSVEAVGATPTHHLVHVPAGEFSEHKVDLKRSITIGDLAQMFHVPDDWIVDIWPSPQHGWKAAPVREQNAAKVIFAAAAGSTIRFMSARR